MKRWLNIEKMPNNLKVLGVLAVIVMTGLIFLVFSQAEKRAFQRQAVAELRIIANEFANLTARHVLEADRAFLVAQRLILLLAQDSLRQGNVYFYLSSLVAQSPEVLGLGLFTDQGVEISLTPYLQNAKIHRFIPKVIDRHERFWANPQVFTKDNFPEQLSESELIVSRILISDRGVKLGYALAMVNLDLVGERYHSKTLKEQISLSVFDDQNRLIFETKAREGIARLGGEDLMDFNQQGAGIYETEFVLAIREDAGNLPVYAVAERPKSSAFSDWYGLNAFLALAFILFSAMALVVLKLINNVQKIRNRHMVEAREHSRVLMDLKAIAFEFDLEKSCFVFIGPQALHFSGQTLSALTSPQGWQSLLREQDVEMFLRGVRDACDRGGEGILEVQLKDRSGHLIWHQANISFQEDKPGKVVQGTFVEITDLKNLQDTLKVALDSAKQANRAKSDFLAKMSHEIRTPMVGIKGVIDLLKAHPKVPPQLRPLLKDLDVSSDNLLDLLNDVLDISKIEAGKLELDCQPSDVSQLVEESFKLFFIPAQEQGVNLVLKNNLKAGTYHMIDVLRVRQVLANILGNAIKFTPEGKVTLCAGLQNGRLLVSIEDSGIGMTDKELEKIFKPFEQADSSTTRQFGGTGLGLSITRELVHAMGGSLSVTSRKGRGSIFNFEIPLVEVPRPVLEQDGGDGDLPTLEILLVEDNVINQRVVRAMLENNNMNVTCAFDGQEALELANTEKFDIILMDMHMPKMGGEEATELIRNGNGPNVDSPIYAFTADTLKEHTETYLKSGVDGVIAKPINWVKLQVILKNIIKN